MLVFSYAVELDAADPKGDGYADLAREASAAYRKRAACQQLKGDAKAARRDGKRAEALDAKFPREDVKAAAGEAPRERPGLVRVRNDWSEPVTLHIAGASYTLRPGETRTLPTPAGTFPYEMQAGANRVRATLEAGRGYSIGAPPAAAP